MKLPFALAAALGVLVSACKAPPPPADEKLPPQVSLFGVRLHSWEGNDLVSTGRAAKLTYDRSSRSFGAFESLVRLPQSSFGAMEIRAPEASGNVSTRQVEGQGGITARADNGLTARTPRATFDGVGFVARGPEQVHIAGPGYAHKAAGFTFYLATEELLFDGPVDSRLGAEGPAK